VLALAVSLLEQTHIRIGNNGYEKLNGSYGLTTLKDNHVKISDSRIVFTFTGKKGITHELSVNDRRLARIVRQCRDIPGKELFQYYTGEGSTRSIDSGMLNNYIRHAAGADFSAKDFRTWAGSRLALECFQRMKGEEAGNGDMKKNITQMLDEVSSALGNTRNICKKYYVHPGLVSLYEEKKFYECVETCNSQKITAPGLDPTEKILMQLLKNYLAK
jgi:DNA topoisomerase-1